MKGTLKALGVKVVDPCQLVILEDKEYQLQIARTWDSTYYEYLGLYRVTTKQGKDHFAIAEDKAGAMSQVSCLYEQNHDDSDTEGMHVVVVPVLLRGWG